MISKKMYELGTKKSTIREIFEFGKKRAAEVGEDNVFDYSIGNPSVLAPPCFNESIKKILDENKMVHGYTSAQGDLEVRKTIVNHLNNLHGTNFNFDNLYITCGAAAALTITLNALSVPEDEYITFAPYFPEYNVFVEGVGAKLKVIPADVENFQIDFEKFEKEINKNTKGIIMNSPNNPSGCIYSEETIEKLAEILNRKSEELGTTIYIIADEPYRELAYNGVRVPYVTKYYKNTIVCYSYSKSLSLAGERLGYVLVPDEVVNANEVYPAVCGAGRVLGYVNAPSLMQRAVAANVDQTSDVSIYERNLNLLYDALIEYGYECVKPAGAFYLFPRSLEEDARAFCEKAKEFDILLVPGDDFGCPGHVRISYCVPTEKLERSLPAFKKLAEAYGK